MAKSFSGAAFKVFGAQARDAAEALSIEGASSSHAGDVGASLKRRTLGLGQGSVCKHEFWVEVTWGVRTQAAWQMRWAKKPPDRSTFPEKRNGPTWMKQWRCGWRATPNRVSHGVEDAFGLLDVGSDKAGPNFAQACEQKA